MVRARRFIVNKSRRTDKKIIYLDCSSNSRNLQKRILPTLILKKNFSEVINVIVGMQNSQRSFLQNINFQTKLQRTNGTLLHL
jgi:hypothetical protein